MGADLPTLFGFVEYGLSFTFKSSCELREVVDGYGGFGFGFAAKQFGRMKMFAVKVEDGKEGRDGEPSVGPVYRNLLAKNEFPPLHFDLGTTWDIFKVSVDKFPSNRMLGWREFIEGKVGPYVWKTYKEVYEEVLHVGSALRSCGAAPGSKIGIYGSNCPQWIVAMEACSAHSLICVPLYDTLGPGAVNFIIDHAEIDFVFVQDKKLKELLNPECTHAQRLKLVVCFTTFREEEKDKATSIGVKPFSWNEFLHMGKEYPSELVPPQPFNICTIMYTSGTSGDPKGVILTHENIATCIEGVDLFMEQFEDKMTVDDVYISFLPLAHVLDRMIEEYFFHKGASVGYYHGNLNALRDDLMELKPTFFAGVPRAFERVHEGVIKALEELNPFRRRMFDIFYKYKLFWMNLGFKQKNASPLADLLAFRKVKARLGGRIRLIVSGGAPLSTEVEEFLRVTTCAFVLQGYGLTETCGLTTLGFPDEMSMIGTVGSVFVYSELRLEEVPDMGYNPLGDPPRGEICIRGKTAFAGYYKNPELTRETMRDGWFHTGDIGEMQPNGVVNIIDRKKNLVKLSQGEYVALEHLEKVHGFTPIVEDIWVYGDSFKSMLVAVVVPHEENTKRWAHLNGHRGSFSELCSLSQLKDHVVLELKSTAERNKLRGFEYIKGVILEPQPFDVERDLVTPTLKKRRDKLLKCYKVEIDELYQKLSQLAR
ncbi:long chain acyl-CoA synthetase 1-like isoform X2 [Cornus florida]|uniref:long chain acyl-CoA synthetase 1-like isoform X2 n=1 Tax=Cornus florida TaxID=4283 RepID=UPI00289673E5|nr:long chain acyl-CoA synthetase 1-like isoform X2 [Cornus florida]